MMGSIDARKSWFYTRWELFCYQFYSIRLVYPTNTFLFRYPSLYLDNGRPPPRRHEVIDRAVKPQVVNKLSDTF
jgi:hypothetical protein